MEDAFAMPQDCAHATIKILPHFVDANLAWPKLLGVGPAKQSAFQLTQEALV